MSMSGPIPGENYTSDTKNYPWHRPPEFDDVDKAIEHVAQKLTSEDVSMHVLTLVEQGFKISTITDMFLTSGMGKGKWTMDMALLMAGPVAHILCLMCAAEDIEYDLGVDDKDTPPTKAYFNTVNKDYSEKDKTLKKLEEVPNPKTKPVSSVGNLMGGY